MAERTSFSAVFIQGESVVIRNCYIRHNRQGVLSSGENVDKVLIEFCEFDSNGDMVAFPDSAQHSVYLMTYRPGATAIVQHCWFHDGTGGTLLKSKFPRTVVRYNWFDSAHIITLLILPPMSDEPRLFPVHADVVGNVFDQGRSPFVGRHIMKHGAEDTRYPGIEGDEDYYRRYDGMIDERASVCATWERGWYEAEKAFARLRRGRFDDGLHILTGALIEANEWVGTRPRPERKEDVVRRIRAGFSVAYRARFGTVAGFDEFWEKVSDYTRYGPDGEDGEMGTDDDLEVPI